MNERLPTKNDIPDFIKESGYPYFLTGSIAFECQHNKSDIDIAVGWADFEQWKNLMKSKCYDITESNYNESLKGTFTNQSPSNQNTFTINIIPLHSSDYLAWYLTTKMIADCKIFIPQNYYVNKHIRLSIFQTLIAMNKLTFTRFDKNGNINSANILDVINKLENNPSTPTTHQPPVDSDFWKNLL